MELRRAVHALLFVASANLGVSACKLTEEIRTRPAGQGTVNSPNNDPPDAPFAFPQPDAALDASGIQDGSPLVDGSPATGGRASGGAGGAQPADGGSGGTGGAAGGDPGDASPSIGGSGGRNLFDAACPVTSSACSAYCTALTIAPNCDYDAFLPEGGVDPLAAAQCECECEASFRMECRDLFDELIACGGRFLMLTCEDGQDVPVVSGECGARRYALQNCLAANAVRDSSVPPG